MTASSTGELRQLHYEMKVLRREIQEIKEMLIPEVAPSRDEIRAIERGRKEYARGEFVEWKNLPKSKKKKMKRSES